MDTRITARHFTLTDSKRDEITQKLTRLTKVYDGITDTNIVLQTDGEPPNNKSAEIVLRVYRQTLTADCIDCSYDIAVNRCIEKLRRQLLRYKAKLKSVDRYVEK